MTTIEKTADNASETALPGIAKIAVNIGEAFATMDRHEAAEFESRRNGHDRAARWHKEQAARAHGTTQALRALLPTMTASNSAEAAVQVAEAINLAAALGDDEADRAADLAKINRLLFSAAEALRAETGQVLPYGLYSTAANPWRAAPSPRHAALESN